MVGGTKKTKNQDIQMVVRDNKAVVAPVTAILITSQCVEHQLFFDPFVMISIQPVRTLQIQNGFCRISRYCVTVSLTKHPAESCISNLLPHVRICLTVSTWAAYCFSKVPYLCVCVRWVKEVSEVVFSIFMSGSRVVLISSVQLCGSVLSPQHRSRLTGSPEPVCI